MFTKLRKSMIYEEIIEQVKAMIISGNLKPGDKLPSERKMMTNLGISRVSLREALKSLNSLGLIETKVGEGHYISVNCYRGLSSLNLISFIHDDVRFSILETRLIIEPAAVKMAVQRITEPQITELELCIEEMLIAIRDKSLSFLKPDQRFHEIIFEATHNIVLINMMKSLGELGIVINTEGKLRSTTEHKSILDAIKVKNADEAARLMEMHIRSTKEDVIKALNKEVVREKYAFES